MYNARKHCVVSVISIRFHEGASSKLILLSCVKINHAWALYEPQIIPCSSPRSFICIRADKSITARRTSDGNGSQLEVTTSRPRLSRQKKAPRYWVCPQLSPQYFNCARPWMKENSMSATDYSMSQRRVRVGSRAAAAILVQRTTVELAAFTHVQGIAYPNNK